MFWKSTVNKTVTLFLVLLKYREIITVKTVTLYKKIYFILLKDLKARKKKLALTSFCNISQEIWLDNSEKFIYIDQSRFYISLQPREFRNV